MGNEKYYRRCLLSWVIVAPVAVLLAIAGSAYFDAQDNDMAAFWIGPMIVIVGGMVISCCERYFNYLDARENERRRDGRS